MIESLRKKESYLRKKGKKLEKTIKILQKHQRFLWAEIQRVEQIRLDAEKRHFVAIQRQPPDNKSEKILGLLNDLEKALQRGI
jgi:hypothetical protein